MVTDQTTDIEKLSLAEQVSLTSGAGFWRSVAIGSIPSFMLTDGPHGIRKQTDAEDHLGIAPSEPATCFPPAVGLGQSWDPDLVSRVGAALGDEAQAQGVGVLLGPGINIKRDPRCGRNFEYFSEDPLHTGILGTAWVRGLQSRGVAASLKHFALNNQETDRMRISSEVDERTMREIYLRGFEHVVRDAEPWTVMCSYNRINGVHASQDPWLLTRLLREEWGFEGAVVSDWGAVVDKVAAIAAGLDLQMPGPMLEAQQTVIAAVEQGELTAAAVETAASRVASLAHLIASADRPGATFDVDTHHELAREAARAAVVLLKNDRALLPLGGTGSVAVIGEFATEPRYQGGGSSHVRPTRLDVPLQEMQQAAERATITFAPGFTTGKGDSEALRDAAVELAEQSDSAVVFLGLSAAQESEGFDRDHINLPADQLDLLAAVLRVQPDTVVVLAHGGVVALGEVAQAPAVLDGALLGQGGGRAIADVLFGHSNPSGRLTETVPTRIQDVPAWLSFPGEKGKVRYDEGLFVGYRWYDSRELDVAFPFGHGLSYTSFSYADPRVLVSDDSVTVTVSVTNSGNRTGREVVQVYSNLGNSPTRPRRELKGFATVDLTPGEHRDVAVRIPRRDLAIWDIQVHGWIVEGGSYDFHIGSSSRDIRATVAAAIVGDAVRVPLSLESSFAEVFANPIAGPALMSRLGGDAMPAADSENELGMDMARMAASIPVGRYLGGDAFSLSKAEVSEILDEANRR